jgi:hypothetical protein
VQTREQLLEKKRKYAKAYKLRLKQDVLDHYGRACSACGFDDYRALQIDHIENDGAAHRKALGGKSFSGWRFYEWLVKNDFPTGFQTLCANCNNIKQWEQNK